MSFLSWFQGGNRRIMAIQKKLTEKQPLPVGHAEFHFWAERIISAAGLPSLVEDQKYVLANVIASNCGPAVGFESDAFFISYLRKAAANQVAIAVRDEIYAAKKAAKTHSQSAAGAPEGAGGKLLEIGKVQEP